MITDKQVWAACVSYCSDWDKISRAARAQCMTAMRAALEAAEAARECAVPQEWRDFVAHRADDLGEPEYIRERARGLLLAAAPSSAEPADYPNPGAPARLRPAVTGQEPASPGVVSEAPKKWLGLKDLEYVIERLRETCSFRDEEGDVTDGLESLLNAIKAAQPSAPGVDVQALIEAVLPGGSSCDPQRVADEIRAWFSDRPAQPSADDAPRDRPTPEMLAEFVRVYSGADWSENRSQLTKRQLARAEKAYAAMMRIAPDTPPADARDAERIKFIAERMTEMTVEEDHEGRLYTINFTNPGARPDGAWVSSEKSVVDCIDMALAGRMGENGCNELLPAWPECSGDPACCPENEGYGCCKPNPADRAMGGE